MTRDLRLGGWPPGPVLPTVCIWMLAEPSQPAEITAAPPAMGGAGRAWSSLARAPRGRIVTVATNQADSGTTRSGSSWQSLHLRALSGRHTVES